ncbi:uncharacterized protein [Spinacia oleracea]|uniref:Uncharacterized protein n=1 Tax=Spinacia oleracea TaxID=3562 RepID=A0ABM3R7I2_SPIOL|nr:uncharacterized protein LOC130459294 [Spinacia oleracea]XP_056684693.1 uncharacterized protein LOC130460907 [Spinacia oleracea]XP_056686493.1 uncharacterized protein LOC130462377 [Spinacia oleracea]XP_056686675.1 uncharacterized protein LOC130462462 [Spinacia oleracea]XP_056687555.1 uncharacterized protein LOC130462734 [Spinacia oleracea]XP_056687691.1 uncharacterized protein LOC130462796 [Spinacia oleracea]XP_056690047.1 uncharacterized protein LOC130464929 [Spinacia oleracea]XP_05669138
MPRSRLRMISALGGAIRAMCHVLIGTRRHGNFAHNICPSRRAFLETHSGAFIGDFRRVPTTIRRFPATRRLILFLVTLIPFFAKLISFFAKLILFFTKYFADLSRGRNEQAIGGGYWEGRYDRLDGGHL